jgi:DoxX-like family
MNAQLIAINAVATDTQTPSRGKNWAGWIVASIPALFLLSGGINALLKAGFVLEGMTHLGYQTAVAPGIGLAQLLCSLLYAIPRTAIWGALLMTAYLGGATASHIRVGEPFFPPILFAVIVWAGLALRDRRLVTVLFSAPASQS